MESTRTTAMGSSDSDSKGVQKLTTDWEGRGGKKKDGRMKVVNEGGGGKWELGGGQGMGKQPDAGRGIGGSTGVGSAARRCG